MSAKYTQSYLVNNKFMQKNTPPDPEKQACGEPAREPSRYSLKDGFFVVAFIVIAFLTAIFVAVCITKSYAHYRKNNVQGFPVKCCRNRLLIHTMTVNISKNPIDNMLDEVIRDTFNSPLREEVVMFTADNRNNTPKVTPPGQGHEDNEDLFKFNKSSHATGPAA